MPKKLKCLISMLVLCGSLCVAQNGKQAELRIHYKGADVPSKMRIIYHTTGEDHVTSDSFAFENRQATLRIQVADVTKVTLFKEGKHLPKDQAVIFIDAGPTTIHLNDSLPDVQVLNTTIHQQYTEYKKAVAEEQAKFEELKEQFGRAYKNKARTDSLRPHYNAARTALDSANYRFIRHHPRSWFSLYKLNDVIYTFTIRGMYKPGSNKSYAVLKNMYDQLDGSLKRSFFGRKVAGILKGAGAALVGNRVVDFTMPDKEGNIIDTRKLRGKIYLIDFWGSWCVYCRKGHPHLKKLYEKYQPKGFEIIAIAKEYGSDRNKQREKWLKAIAEDGLPWKHILNDDSRIDLPEAFGVNAYPTKLLIDQDGKIILRVTDDDERLLDGKLEELFGR